MAHFPFFPPYIGGVGKEGKWDIPENSRKGKTGKNGKRRSVWIFSGNNTRASWGVTRR